MKLAIISALFFLLVPSALAEVQEADTSNLNFASLSVPFFVQAPLGNWSWPWEDFCEEASSVMAHAYVTGRIPNQLEAAYSMLEVAIFELKTFGIEKDTNLDLTRRILNEYFHDASTSIVENPTAEVIRNEIRQGNIVLVPVAGRLLHNPYFVHPGPRYHMVLVKGFDHDQFIVNEPGTRRGDGLRYSEATLMNAMHDLVPDSQTILSGRKAILVVQKS